MPSNKTVFRYRSTLHPLISTSIALAFAIVLRSLISDVSGFPGAGPLFYILVVLASLTEIVVGNLVLEERAGVLARLREGVIVIGVAYLATGVLFIGDGEPIWTPRILNLMNGAFAGITWLVTLYVHASFRKREDFLATVAGKSGEDLRHALRGGHDFNTETIGDLKRARTIAIVLYIVPILVFVVAWLLDRQVRLGTMAFFVVYGVTFFFVTAAINVFVDDFNFYGDGIPVPSNRIRRRLESAAVVIAGATILALIVSSNRALLPLSAIGRFFEWLRSLIPEMEPMEAPPPRTPVSPSLDRPGMLDELHGLDEERAPAPWLLLVLLILRRLFYLGLIVGAVIFLIIPFFSTSFRERLRRFKPYDTVLKVLSAFARYVRMVVRLTMFRLKHRRRRGARVRVDEADPNAIAGLGRRRVSREKRKELDEISERFYRLMAWSRENGTPYLRHETPEEYGDKLGASFPAHREKTDRIIVLFETAVFSNHLIGNEGMKEFTRLIDSVTQIRP